MIEEQMQECGHEMAGYVVYRISYDSDADWKEFLVRLNAELEHTFELCNGKDVFEKFSLTVMDDRELFNAASTDDIRQHFQAWAAQNYLSEQPQAKDHGEHAVVRVEGSSRYRYAIYADAECLHSITHGDVVAVNDGRWVKMIRSAWKQDLDDGEEPYEPLEGVTQYDVGWMKVELSSLVEFYEYGYDPNYWDRFYRRSPEILSL